METRPKRKPLRERSRQEKEEFLIDNVESLALNFIERSYGDTKDDIILAARRSIQVLEQLKKMDQANQISFKIISRAFDIMAERHHFDQEMLSTTSTVDAVDILVPNMCCNGVGINDQEKSADLLRDSSENIVSCDAENQGVKRCLCENVQLIIENKGIPFLESVKAAHFDKGFTKSTRNQEKLLVTKDSEIAKLLEELGYVSRALNLKQERINNLHNDVEKIDLIICGKTKSWNDTISVQQKSVLAKESAEIELKIADQHIASLKSRADGLAQNIDMLTERLKSFKQLFPQGVSVGTHQVAALKTKRKLAKDFDRVCGTLEFGKSWKPSFRRLTEMQRFLENEFRSKRGRKGKDAEG